MSGRRVPNGQGSTGCTHSLIWDWTATQVPQGPVAALEIIKNLDRRRFFNANRAHPYENPTPLSNLIEMLAIVLLPAALARLDKDGSATA